MQVKDKFYVYDSSHSRFYRYDREAASARGWILQEELLAPKLLVFPSTGGLIFRKHNDRAYVPDETDGNVVSEPQKVRSCKLPYEVVLTDQQEQDLGLKYMSRDILGIIKDVRRLWAEGDEHALVLKNPAGMGIMRSG